MNPEPPLETVRKFFSEAEKRHYHKRAFTVLQGDDEDNFIVCEKDLTDPHEDLRRWIGRGNSNLCVLMARLLRNEDPYGIRVNLTVPFSGPQPSAEGLPE